MVVGGLVSSVNGEPGNNLFRLAPGGRREAKDSFNPGTGPNNHVNTIAIQPDGKILIGGNFTSVNSQPRNGYARLNRDGTLESSSAFKVGTGADANVNSIALQSDGKILIGGAFSSVNGQARRGIARLFADGTVEPLSGFDTTSSVTSGIMSMNIQDDGLILLGGKRLLPNGSLNNGFQLPSNPGGSLITTAVIDPAGDYALGGRYFVQGVPMNTAWGVRRMSAVNGLFLSLPNPPDNSEIVWSLALQANGKTVAGGFWESGPRGLPGSILMGRPKRPSPLTPR